MLESSSLQGRQFKKSGCQLSQFPIIKLHIFTDITFLDLSNNLISDLAPLHTHSGTTPYVLSKLRVVNLAQNQFASVQTLLPLAKAGRGIEVIDISSNPLVQNLNFLYQIALGFERVTKIICGYEVAVDGGVRQAMVKHQMQGGSIINTFLHTIEKRSQSMCYNMQKEKEMLQNLLLQLQHPPHRINQQNQRIFHVMQQFISQSSPPSSSPTYRSPAHLKYSSEQIQVRSEYQVASPNILLRYLTQGDERTGQLAEFYYRELVMRHAINGKLLQEIQVEESVLLEIQEGRKEIQVEEFMLEVRKKWRSNLKMTSELRPAYSSQQGSRISHFKSIQTDISSHPHPTIHPPPLSGQYQLMYFGFDREWTYQTLQFLRHRLVSLIRGLIKSKLVQRQDPQTFIKCPLSPSPSPYQSPPSHTYAHNHQASNFSSLSPTSSLQQFLPSTFSSRSPPNLNININTNYQTFGPSYPQATLLSPKSRNKFIIGSLVNVLELIIKRIVLNRIIKARTIKNQEIMYLHFTTNTIIKKYQQHSFRKIFQISIFYQCLQEKMEAFKKKIVFKAWKQLKKRKMKLLKGMLVRKMKKQNALLSVFLTQMRLNSRSITLQHKMLKSKAQLLSSSTSNDLQDLSCILRRSATCQKTLQLQNPHSKQIKIKETDRNIQARRNFLKRNNPK